MPGLPALVEGPMAMQRTQLNAQLCKEATGSGDQPRSSACEMNVAWGMRHPD